MRRYNLTYLNHQHLQLIYYESDWSDVARQFFCLDFYNASNGTTINSNNKHVQYIPRNMHTVFALLCFVVVIHWLNFPDPSGLLHWHCGNLTIAPVPAKQPWWIWINTSCEFIMNDCITTTKQSTTKPCAYFLGYTVYLNIHLHTVPPESMGPIVYVKMFKFTQNSRHINWLVFKWFIN